MADYSSAYTGAQIDTLLGKVSNVENAVSSLSLEVSTLDSAVTDKVDKVAGKGLSENDYTNADKAKLTGLPTGSEIGTALDGKASASTVSALSSSVSSIESKIPSSASASNQLADKYYVTNALALKADNSTVSAIEAKIPSEASSSNQLADKSFVVAQISSAISGSVQAITTSEIDALFA